MNLQRGVLNLVLGLTPVALLVAVFASRDMQRRVLPVFALLILLLVVGAVYRFWPRRERVS